MEFMVAIVKGLLERPDATLSAIVHDCYHATLHRWHGWLASSAFAVAFAFVPHRGPFLDRIAGGKFTAATEAEMRQFVDVFGGMLGEVHAFIERNGLDDPYKV
jgi:Ca2+:H+ antiporter